MKFLILTPYTRDTVQYVRWLVASPEKTYESGLIDVFLYEFDPAVCGRKNFALNYALDYLRNDVEYDAVLVADADVRYDLLNTLRQFRFQLSISNVAVCGMRRFTNTATFPSATRLVWQHYAQWPMKFFGISWGGLLAFDRADERTVKRIWATTLFDDLSAFKQHEFEYDRLTFGDDVSVWHRWTDVWNFVIRQLVDVRLYGPWYGVWASWFFVISLACLQLNQPWAVTAAAYVGVCVGLGKGWKTIPGLVAAQVIHLLSVPYAHFVQRIEWAGVKYELKDFK
jgi:hypothetical protein